MATPTTPKNTGTRTERKMKSRAFQGKTEGIRQDSEIKNSCKERERQQREEAPREKRARHRLVKKKATRREENKAVGWSVYQARGEDPSRCRRGSSKRHLKPALGNKQTRTRKSQYEYESHAGGRSALCCLVHLLKTWEGVQGAWIGRTITLRKFTILIYPLTENRATRRH